MIKQNQGVTCEIIHGLLVFQVVFQYFVVFRFNYSKSRLFQLTFQLLITFNQLFILLSLPHLIFFLLLLRFKIIFKFLKVNHPHPCCLFFELIQNFKSLKTRLFTFVIVVLIVFEKKSNSIFIQQKSH